MDAERCLLRVIAVLIGKVEALWLREIYLVSRERELPADRTPDLHVDLRTVEGGLVRHFHVVDAGALENAAHHILGLLPELRLIDKLLSKPRRVVSREAHHILLDPEE